MSFISENEVDLKSVKEGIWVTVDGDEFKLGCMDVDINPRYAAAIEEIMRKILKGEDRLLTSAEATSVARQGFRAACIFDWKLKEKIPFSKKNVEDVLDRCPKGEIKLINKAKELTLFHRKRDKIDLGN